MMSKKQWFILLGLIIVYLLLGACFFYQTETRAETTRRRAEREKRTEIEGNVSLEVSKPKPVEN